MWAPPCQPRRLLVGFQRPLLTILEIIDQLLIFFWPHIARPDNLCPIDIGLVVHPFVEYVVFWGVMDNNKVLPGLHFEPFDESVASERRRAQLMPCGRLGP